VIALPREGASVLVLEHGLREFTVDAVIEASLPSTIADMAARGWLPASVLVRGKRGARFLCFVNAATGELSKVAR